MQKLRSAIKRNPRLMPHYRKAYNLINMLKRLIADSVYMDWSYLVLDEQKVAYIVIQKVACTSIKASMISMESGENYLAVNKAIRRTGHVLPKLDPATHGQYYVFTFVRNPFERLISCYENKFHTDRAIPGKTGMKFEAYLMGYLGKDRGFKSFARRVCRIPDRISDHHFASQSFMIDRMGQNPKPDFVGHYERLQEEYEPIRERFGFMPLPHHNKTPKALKWMDYYDIPTAQRVYRRYREDIERFGYRETYEQLLVYLGSRKETP